MKKNPLDFGKIRKKREWYWTSIERKSSTRIRSYWIDSAKPYILLHIPKTGGNAISVALNMPIWRDHPTARAAKKRFFDVDGGEEFWERSFKFCFVRNPWDRACSSFFHLLSSKDEGLRDDDLKEMFLQHLKNPKITKNHNVSQERFWLLHRRDGRNLENEIDFVGRYESIDRDFRRLCSLLGVPHRTLPGYPSHRDYRKWYCEEGRHIVAERDWRTIDNFRYEF